MSNREKIISAIEKAKKQSEENAQDVIIVPFKEANMILALLKEHENKKLVDAGKLREKLGFAEYCEDCKRDSWKCGCETIYSLCDFCTTIDIAIEELMQEGR